MDFKIGKISLSVIACFVLFSCVKQKVELDKLESEEIDPSFALPLGEATINLGRVESHFVDDHFEYNASTGLLEYVFPKRLFELYPIDILKFPNPNASASATMPPGTQSAFNAGGPGNTVSFSGSQTVTFNAPNGELMDSIIFRQATLDVNVSSDFPHNTSIDVVIPGLTLNGAVFNQTINLNYGGTVPIVNNVQFDISGYSFDLTDGGVTDNTADFSFNIQMTSSGIPVLGTEQIDFTVDFLMDTIERAYGYFGSYTNILSEDTLEIDFFENLSGGSIHVEDPRIELAVYNTTGVSVHSDFNAVYAPDNSVNINLGGPGLTTIPLIVGAATINDTGITNHLINNGNTSPTLSAIIDEGPGEMIYDASSETNPSGVTQNFITYQSKVWCDSRLVMPLYGWGNNFEFRDTTKSDISKALDVDSATIENLKTATLRVIADNGLPVEASIQLYFVDSNDVLVDSLFDNTSGANVIQAATVNFSVPTTDPNYGRVIPNGAKRKITDVVIEKERFNNIANSGVTQLVYVAKGNTNDANLARNVKFYPEYNLKMKVSAKLDLLYKLQP